MKIAVVLKKDTNNFSIARLVKSFLLHGHKAEGFAVYNEENHLYMFKSIDFNIQSISALTKESLKQYDFLLAYPNIFYDMHWLIDEDIYIVSFDPVYFGEPLIGTDLLIKRGIGYAPSYGHRADSAYLISGEPKHDVCNFSEITEITNRLLFIDSGHYPFGEDGKRALACFILNVCKKFPDYNLVVKPRFLKSDKNVTHKSILHLYDFIMDEAAGELPKNLILLWEHHTLEELIASAHTVICTYTTAYIDAAVQGKNLIILDNLPNEEHPELRIKSHWMPVREVLKDTGCLVNYQDAINYLPEGIPCSEEHINANIYSGGEINNKIVKSIEWIWEHYISQRQYPAPANYFYDKLDTATFKIVTMERLKELRKKNFLYWIERNFYRCTTFFPDNNKIEQYINDLDCTGQLQNHSINDLMSALREKLLDYADDIPKDEISQNYLLIEILNSNKPEKIFSMRREEASNKVFYDFVVGKVYFNKADYNNASRSLHSYLDGCVSHNSACSLHNMPMYHLSALYYCGLADMELQRYEEAKQCFLECEVETNGNHRKAKEQLEIINQIETRKFS